ncbi:hypothetical protein SAMN05216223_10446 [Actinacidiphila yanglinensis]|uniref:Uncharacterized protein n=2 Tax=Actinacidiphila yanglinensis TaxID=310779 RepID=A0A1H5YLV0_9ACTN|nr:hypothetical protein SAMN05216223_10446 [Actinacidiphila yanglinensis]
MFFVMVRVGQARRAAARWVGRYGRGSEGYLGAYVSGSTVGMPDDAELPATSDIDVVVVSGSAQPPPKLGKIRHEGALLEVTTLPWSALDPPARVLESYHLAGSFRTDTLLDDPTGRLAQLRAYVEPRFARPRWVLRRCADARTRIESGLEAFDPAAPFHQALTAWLFPAAVTTHVILVAALRNPTVRLRYRAARVALEEYGHAGLYPELLGLLGCAEVSAERVGRHLDALAATFDATAAVARTRFPFSGDLTPEARPVAIDGSRALVDGGEHREAVFWILATFARCHAVLAADAPGLGAELEPDFRSAARELAGVDAAGSLPGRVAEVGAFVPRVWRTAEAMVGSPGER